MYEDEFELTFNLSGEEPQPEQAAQEPPVPPKPKAAAPVVDEPTRVMVLEKPQPAPPAGNDRSLCRKSRRKHRHLPCRQQPMAAVC